MDVTALGPLALAVAGGVVLLAAGVRHAAGYRSLVTVLHRQRLLPAEPLVAAALVVAELAVGGGALALLALRGDPRGFAVQAALYLAFAGYLTVLLVTRPGSECGCGYADGARARPWQVWANGALAAASGLVAVPSPPTLPALLLAVAVVAATVSSTALLAQAWLPAERLRPARLRPGRI